jgi:hypothetical protein
MGIYADSTGVIFIADTNNNTIRVLTSDGSISTFAGSAGISGSFDGTGINALFNLPRGLATDGAGGIFIADTGNNSIRRLNSAGRVFTVAGYPGIAGYREGTGTNALFNQPEAIAYYGGGVFVSDTGNQLIRQIVTTGAVTSPLLSSSSSSGGGGGDSGNGGSGGGGGGGGGAPSVWFLAALSVLGLRRVLKRAA